MNTSAHNASHANIIELEWKKSTEISVDLGAVVDCHDVRNNSHAMDNVPRHTWYWRVSALGVKVGLVDLRVVGKAKTQEDACREAQDWVNRFAVIYARERDPTDGHNLRITR